jgi:hypothetical protein
MKTKEERMKEEARRLNVPMADVLDIIDAEIEMEGWKTLLTHPNIDDPNCIIQRPYVEERIDNMMQDINDMKLTIAEKRTIELYRELQEKMSFCAGAISRMANHVVDNWLANDLDTHPEGLRPYLVPIPMNDRVMHLAKTALKVERYRNELREAQA